MTQGIPGLPDAIQEKAQDHWDEPARICPHITHRELECVYWLLNGKTVPEIALILGISKRTVEKFIHDVKTKLCCCTLFQLGHKIAEVGLDKECQSCRA